MEEKETPKTGRGAPKTPKGRGRGKIVPVTDPAQPKKRLGRPPKIKVAAIKLKRLEGEEIDGLIKEEKSNTPTRVIIIIITIIIVIWYFSVFEVDTRFRIGRCGKIRAFLKRYPVIHSLFKLHQKTLRINFFFFFTTNIFHSESLSTMRTPIGSHKIS